MHMLSNTGARRGLTVLWAALGLAFCAVQPGFPPFLAKKGMFSTLPTSRFGWTRTDGNNGIFWNNYAFGDEENFAGPSNRTNMDT